MKEKILGLLVKVKENKKVVIPIAIAILALIVLAIVVFGFILGGKPSKYESKIKDVTKALYSESKMKSVINDGILDLRGMIAYDEAEQKTDKFNKEYKKIKKDDDDVKDLKDELKDLAKELDDEDMKIKVSKIKKPKKDSKNSKIYTVSATLTSEDEYYGDEDEIEVKFVFYKNSIIDIVIKDSKESLFKALP